MSKTTSTFLGLLTAAVLLVFAIIAAAIGFSWFSDSTEASATGMSVSAKGDLQIRNESNGEDIGVVAPSADMKTITDLKQDPSKLTTDGSISPGSSGSFSFYVYNPRRSSYSFACDMEIVNDPFADNEGYYRDAKPENKAAALQYANSHIMLFRNRTGSEYSGWIQPGEPLELAAESNEQQVTVYWVWVPFFDNIFGDAAGNMRIADADRQAMRDYYGAQSNGEKMFTQSGQSSVGYNEADFIFGSTIQKICFNVYVREV